LPGRLSPKRSNDGPHLDQYCAEAYPSARLLSCAARRHAVLAVPYISLQHTWCRRGSCACAPDAGGEQPGDNEDLSGRPFVGPAGKILDRAPQEAQITRRDIYVTNAVKHFKYEVRGKRRLHKRPNTEEIDQCKWWLDQELQLVRPRVVIALGATAARSLLGRVVTISSTRGVNQRLADGKIAVVTIHPSYLLRLRDAADKDREYRAFCC